MPSSPEATVSFFFATVCMSTIYSTFIMMKEADRSFKLLEERNDLDKQLLKRLTEVSIAKPEEPSKPWDKAAEFFSKM